jgi:S-DNA-T family DNA segregation ATPase FtsK/SpoIIIE
MKTELKSVAANLVVTFDKDTNGKPFSFDLHLLPHLFVGGETGSGKSYFLHSVINSLIAQNTPDVLKLILADAKKCDLPVYDGNPFLLRPVLWKAKDVVDALNWCVDEVNRRYDILMESSCKNIETYNKKHKNKMFYVVFVMDEMSDFILGETSKFESQVLRLAQTSSVVGIHMIMASSRPSPEVFTGLMKDNIPARLAFKTTTKEDSALILGRDGAEKLTKQGDAIFLLK